MTSRKPLVGGNWKMNTRRDSAGELARAVVDRAAEVTPGCEVVVIPPFPFLECVSVIVDESPVALGAQNLYPADDGAYTGEVNAGMLGCFGVTHVVVGHSERRHVLGESDAMIAAKLHAALTHGMTAILCVGETEDQRDAGDAERFTLHQLDAALASVPADATERLVIAYEPVWAIGTGRTATPDDAQAMHATIRRALVSQYDHATADSIRILYGGSVKPANASELFACPDIDGGLIGGASLHADDFLAIAHAAASTPDPVSKGDLA